MQSFGTIFLWALAACTLWKGSLATSLRGGLMFLVNDTSPDSICVPELRSLLNDVVQTQNQGNTNTRQSDNEIKSKLETLEVKIGEVQAKLPQEVHAKLEGQLQGFQEGQTKLEGQQTKMEAKLEDSLLAVKTKLEGQGVVLTKVNDSQAKLEGSLLAVQEKIEIQLQAVVNQLQAVSKKVDASKVAVPASSTATIPLGFKLIGNRYFRIVAELEDWVTAERRCRELGGYLASIQNEEELNAFQPKLSEYGYWLGINDRDRKGHFVSVASHKPAPFLNVDQSTIIVINSSYQSQLEPDASSAAIAGFRESVDTRLHIQP
ncbi:uncharacterized protein [Drosophila kikkawai]|uniref:C-type lectin domain-containing protein n=1 Tax=Drosophila kikkawai TaxID=30033 RepID=A0ABM4GA67_DROKI